MEEYRRILIPTDGSEYNMKAVEKGLSLAKLTGASVTALYVVDRGFLAGMPADAMITDILSLLRKEGKETLEKVRKMGADMGVEVRTIIREGDPAAEIVEEAKNNDLIVMGTLGKGALDRLLLGSVAEKVVRHAPCPVMLVRVRN